MAYDTISVTPVTPNIGGLVSGIDLSQKLDEATVKDLHHALMDRQVLLFRDQELTHETQKALGAHFGTLHVSVGGDGTNSKQLSDHPEVRALHFDENSTAISGNEIWHTDQSCMETPPMGTILYIHTVPPDGGGDTMFASMYAAYDALSDNMKRYLEGVTALHDGAGAFARTATNNLPITEHPVIAKHPVTGRRLLYVNPIFTTRICGVSKDESDAILSYLFHHCEHPNFQVRFNWSPHSIAFWDNRCTHHRALWDYYPHTRSGFRIQIEGTETVVPG
ncbi:MAG: taurine dioxygenase [Rhodospirillaceae bacterium]|jgi:taurine dioxygenase|nr:taurine dioxygenase [Rhodospirillaceae bacterium]MBT5457326.1 taurine dioxygenase [Rhodospirillaceae bacterium]